MPWIRSLSQLSTEDAGSYGGKATQLGELIGHGFNVPKGFALSAEAFRYHFEDKLEAGLSSPTQLDHGPNRPRLQPALAQSLREGFDTLFDAPAPTNNTNQTLYVAVRSSALAEDGEHHSYAGQHATYYYITRDCLPEAVVDCWMSLWSAHAQAYRHALTIETVEPPPEMAVIVQLMVNADSAGVVFTEDPSGSFSNHSLIESTWGLGAALVDGRVSPDQFFVGRTGGIARSRIGTKRLYMPPGLRKPSKERLESLAPYKREQSSLTNKQVQQVAELGNNIARTLGNPQDVEWAFAEDELLLLQARPITGSSPLPTPDLEGTDNDTTHLKGRWVWFKPLAENFTEPLTPLTQDLYQRALPSIGRFINGRYYLNFDRVRRLLPLRGTDAEVAQALLLRGGAIGLNQINWLRMPLLLTQLGIAYLATGMFWHRSKALPANQIQRFTTRLRELEGSQVNALQALTQALYGKRVFEPAYNYPFFLNIAAGRYFILQGLLRSILKRWAPQLPTHLVDQLSIGEQGMASREMLNELSKLAQLIKADTELMTLSDQHLLSRLQTLPKEHPATKSLRRFLEHYGHRTARELELATPRWRETPETLLQTLLPLLGSEAEFPDAQQAYKQAQEKLKAALSWPRYWLANQLAQRTRHYVTTRENTRHQTAAVLGVVREKLCAAERELIHQGLLYYRGDVFFLLWNELLQLQQGELTWRDVQDKIRERRQQRLSRSRNTPPMTFNLGLEPPTLNHQLEDANTLVGQCASPGYAEGIARVVMDPASAASKLEPNNILIAPYTDPGWTPLFLSVAAVVVETGSYLSHAGTVAREFKVPCIVDVTRCTDRIPDGAKIRVFADNGVIEILEVPQNNGA